MPWPCGAGPTASTRRSTPTHGPSGSTRPDEDSPVPAGGLPTGCGSSPSTARPGDFQAAVDAWGERLELDPNQYIWRRRIEQYGPRLDKPYPFYDWVDRAAEEIAERGEEPVALEVMPSGAEIAQPAREFEVTQDDERPPDPEGRINRDRDGLVEVEVTVVPARVRPGQAARVHVSFLPDDSRKAHWNNESTPAAALGRRPRGLAGVEPIAHGPPGRPARADEVRRLDFEVEVPPSASGRTRLPAYALYNVCEDVGGVCRFLRQDLVVEVEVEVGP